MPSCHRIDDRRIEQGSAGRSAALVDDPRSLCLCVFDELRHVIDLAGLGQRRDAHALLPGHADLELAQLLGEAAQEGLDDRLMDDQHLQGRAALAVEGQASEEAFLDGKLDIGVRQDDGGVLGVEAENGPQAMRLRVAASSDDRRPCSIR